MSSLSNWIEALESRRLPTAVTVVVLTDADTGRPLGTLADGATLNLAALPPRLTLRAQAAGDTARVRFDLDRRKRLAPPGGDLLAARFPAPAVGAHTLAVKSYARRHGGPAGPPTVLTFTVVVSDAQGPLAGPADAPAGLPPPVPPGDWRLALDQEFTGPPNPAVWSDRFWWDGNALGPGQSEAYDPGQVTTSGGVLSLTARPRPTAGTDGTTHPWASGLLTTGGVRDRQPAGFAFRYGYAEARVRVPAGKGLWPAFWLLPASHHDSAGEIDVMEIRGSAPSVQEMHYHRHGAAWGGSWAAPSDLSAGFHTFAVDWEPDHIAWYVDGVERFRFSTARQVVREPMYPILDLAVGGSWDGPPDSTTPSNAAMRVDWVRVWQK